MKTITKIRVKEIDVDVFLQLCVSHSRLTQDAYKQGSFTSDHYAHKAEESIILELYRLGLTEECCELIEKECK